MTTPTGGLYAGCASFQTRKHPLTVPICEHTRDNKKTEKNIYLIQCRILQSEPALTISDMRALKCWTASSRLCCSLSLSISLVCSDRALCTSRSLSLRLASMRACRSSSFSASASTFYTTQRQACVFLIMCAKILLVHIFPHRLGCVTIKMPHAQ